MSDARSPDETVQILAPDGRCAVPRADLGLSDEDLRELLRLLLFARAADEQALQLQADGELTVYPPFRGQEAAQVGSAFALERADFIFPSFREYAAALVRGVDPATYLEYHRGTWHGGPYDPMQQRFGPVCITLANQIVHAVGFAMGMKLDRRPGVVLTYFGDGAASEGDFHEACNFAGVFGSPVIFFCQNNRWAISTPVERQTAGPIYRRAEGYGFPGVRVDGNDVLAVWTVTRDAAERARSGEGPTLIEAMTYRLGPHHTADDPDKYREAEEVDAAEELDPLRRFRTYLLAEGVVSDDDIVALERANAEALERVAKEVRTLKPPPVEDLFEWVFEGPTYELLRQQADISRFSGTGPVEDAPEPEPEPEEAVDPTAKIEW